MARKPFNPYLVWFICAVIVSLFVGEKTRLVMLVIGITPILFRIGEAYVRR